MVCCRRINFSRVQWKWEWKEGGEGEGGSWVKAPAADGGKQSENNWVWSPQGVINMHCPERWGLVRFLGDGDAAAQAESGLVGRGEADGGEADQERCGRETLMAWHYLLQDWMAAHGGALPPNLSALEAAEEASLPAGTDYGIIAQPDLPGGYLAFVRLSPSRRLCVRGDSLLWTERC